MHKWVCVSHVVEPCSDAAVQNIVHACLSGTYRISIREFDCARRYALFPLCMPHPHVSRAPT